MTCGDGEKTMTRTKNDAVDGGNDCEGDASYTESCNLGECPVDCTWNDDYTAGECSTTCGDGELTMTRTKNDAQNGGNDCEGDASYTEACNLEDCDPCANAIQDLVNPTTTNLGPDAAPNDCQNFCASEDGCGHWLFFNGDCHTAAEKQNQIAIPSDFAQSGDTECHAGVAPL